MTKERVWGISLQLYELRSSRNWGIGDFDDLARLCEIAGSWGADFVGLTPLHAPFLADPDRCSPYEPSNRRFLDPLYIAVDRVSGFKNSPALERTAGKLRNTYLVDYAGVARAKLQVLRQIWQSRKRLSNEDAAEFERFKLPADWSRSRFPTSIAEQTSCEAVSPARVSVASDDTVAKPAPTDRGNLRIRRAAPSSVAAGGIWLLLRAERQLSRSYPCLTTATLTSPSDATVQGMIAERGSTPPWLG